MKIYVILWAQRDSILQGAFNVSEVQFVFTSKARAERQMDKIKELIESGEWWIDVYGKSMCGKVLSDDVITDCFMYEYQRDIVFENPNGATQLYRLICFNEVNERAIC